MNQAQREVLERLLLLHSVGQFKEFSYYEYTQVFKDETKAKELMEKGIKAGYRLMQTHRLAESDLSHALKLLEFMNPEPNSLVIDAGAGIGEFPRLVASARPDIKWRTFSSTLYEVEMCPKQFSPQFGLLHAWPYEAEIADVAFLGWSLGYGRLADVAYEAHRVLKPGGKLIIYDLATPDQYQQMLIKAAFGYALYHPQLLSLEIMDAHFQLDFYDMPEEFHIHPYPVSTFGGNDAFDDVFFAVRPIVYVFSKLEIPSPVDDVDDQPQTRPDFAAEVEPAGADGTSMELQT